MPDFGGATSPSTEDIPDTEPSSEDEDAAISRRAREELQRARGFLAKAQPTTKAMHKNPARRFARPITLSDPQLCEEITAKLCERNPYRTKPWDEQFLRDMKNLNLQCLREIQSEPPEALMREFPPDPEGKVTDGLALLAIFIKHRTEGEVREIPGQGRWEMQSGGLPAMTSPLRHPQYEMWARMDFLRTRMPHYKRDLDIWHAAWGMPQPDLAHKVTRVLAPAAHPHAHTNHFVRTGRCVCLGWLLLEGGMAGFSAAQLWDYWLSLDLIAIKQMRKGGAGAKLQRAAFESLPEEALDELKQAIDEWCGSKGLPPPASLTEYRAVARALRMTNMPEALAVIPPATGTIPAVRLGLKTYSACFWFTQIGSGSSIRNALV